jgi:hypothetical protein
MFQRLKLKVENPLVEEIVNAMFKEAGKQSSNIDITYRQCSLRCLADLIQFTSSQFKDSFFELYWSSVFVMYFEQDLASLVRKDQLRFEQQIEAFKRKNKRKANDMETETVEDQTKNEQSEEMQVEAEKVEEKTQQKEEEVKKADEKTDEEKEKEATNSALKLILMETIGKCWPFSWEIQGFYNFFKLYILRFSSTMGSF